MGRAPRADTQTRGRAGCPRVRAACGTVEGGSPGCAQYSIGAWRDGVLPVILSAHASMCRMSSTVDSDVDNRVPGLAGLRVAVLRALSGFLLLCTSLILDFSIVRAHVSVVC